MELDTAVRRFLDRIPDSTLADAEAVMWSVGQVRGPRVLPLDFGT